MLVMLALLANDAREHGPRDHLDRERRGELGNVARPGARQRVDEVGCQLGDDLGQAGGGGGAREPRRERLPRRQVLRPIVGAEEPAERREALPPNPRGGDRVDLDQPVGALDQKILDRLDALQVGDVRPPGSGSHRVSRPRVNPRQLAPRVIAKTPGRQPNPVVHRGV